MNSALVASLRLFSGDIEAAELKTQPVDQFMDAAAVADGRQILIQDALAGAVGKTAHGVGGQGPVTQLARLITAKPIVAAVPEVSQHHQQEGR